MAEHEKTGKDSGLEIIGPLSVLVDQLSAAWHLLIPQCQRALKQPTAEAEVLVLVQCGLQLLKFTEQFQAWLASADGQKGLELEAEHQVRTHVERLMDLKADPEARWASARWLTDLCNIGGLADPKACQALREFAAKPKLKNP